MWPSRVQVGPSVRACRAGQLSIIWSRPLQAQFEPVPVAYVCQAPREPWSSVQFLNYSTQTHTPARPFPARMIPFYCVPVHSPSGPSGIASGGLSFNFYYPNLWLRSLGRVFPLPSEEFYGVFIWFIFAMLLRTFPLFFSLCSEPPRPSLRRSHTAVASKHVSPKRWLRKPHLLWIFK